MLDIISPFQRIEKELWVDESNLKELLGDYFHRRTPNEIETEALIQIFIFFRDDFTNTAYHTMEKRKFKTRMATIPKSINKHTAKLVDKWLKRAASMNRFYNLAVGFSIIEMRTWGISDIQEYIKLKTFQRQFKHESLTSYVTSLINYLINENGIELFKILEGIRFED